MKQFNLIVLFCYFSFSLAAQNGRWTWASGDNTVDQTGIYGTKGTASPANKPGSRENGVSWKDAANNLWMFGGSGNNGTLNDLWKFNTTSYQWAWMSGDNGTRIYGIYGTKGIASAANKPGSRYGSVSWTDASGNLWLFGGYGMSTANYSEGPLNDLWKYNTVTNQWTWISGDNSPYHGGSYGTKGIALPANKPGCRYGSISWTDASGNLWLFGGRGIESEETGQLNDLWKFNPTTSLWTWVSGDKFINQTGVYGIKGTPSSANKPGARQNSVSWVDASGNLWLFGGSGSIFNDYVITVYFNDLWKFNPVLNQWTWVSGDAITGQNGVYGIKGLPAAANKPGSRESSISWIDASGNLILFGGSRENNQYVTSFFNDLWRYNPTSNQWTWLSGDNTLNGAGIYGTKGTPSTTNKPGARDNSISWIDGSGFLWLFGGSNNRAYDGDALRSKVFNDLWKFDQSVLSCPSSVSVLTDLKNCSSVIDKIDPVITPSAQAPVSFAILGATEAGGLGSVSGKAFARGVSTVAYTLVNDPSQTCRFVITVTDSTKPVPTVASLPDIIGECSVNVTAIPTATDNCAVSPLAGTTKDPLTYNQPGTYSITWTYNDKLGNTSTQLQRVIVRPSSAIPVPVQNPLPDIIGACSAAVISKPTATQDCAGIITATTTDALTYNQQGTYSIKWTYDDGKGNIITQQQRVIVKDTVPPVPALVSLPDVTAQCSITVTAKPTATDNCTTRLLVGTTSDPLAYDRPGTYSITWTYTDVNSNTTKQVQRVIVRPSSEQPVPVLNPLPDIIGECSAKVISKPVASQNCAGIITGTTNDPLTYNEQGTYIITWIYQDGDGNTASQKQRVIVKDTTAPVPALASLPDISGECSATITVKPIATDNCYGTITGITSDPLTYSSQGIHIMRWTYNDDKGNSSTQEQRVIIRSATAPHPVLENLPDLKGECSVTVSSVPSADQPCTGRITGTTTDPLTYTKQGTYIIKWNYNDGNGNTTTQLQNVIVKDITAPVPKLASLPDITAECSALAAIKPSAIDNCAGSITATTNDPLVYNTQGTYNITWTFNDGNGNVITQNQKVIIKDRTAPVPDAVTLPDITGECLVQVTKKPTAIDNCGGLISATTSDPLVYKEKGTYTITWMFTDGAGNSIAQKQRVIVRTLALKLNAFPNPAGDHFNFIVKSCSMEKITIRIFDAFGRFIDTPVNPVTVGEPFSMGSSYPSGVYYAQVIQGKEQETVKLVKIR